MDVAVLYSAIDLSILSFSVLLFC